MGFKIRELQHVLEGYKVAEEIAAHGAGAGTFIDWWGYKHEAYDAIPYNVAIMTRHGVLTSVNSDSDELARHLNHDAAKAMKYGGLTEEEALRTCTINPARQLRLDHRIGSIEAGKDADLAIWNGHPLSSYSRVDTTFIDWWGYKAEAYDATPYNVALLVRNGVLTSVNSDSDELARHLNHDAAKAMKYGGLTEDEALRTCTINPAKQLRLDHRLGSIEVGKDADLAIWNGHPLSTYSRVDTTFIEGEIYFDREQDLRRREALRREKEERLKKEKDAAAAEKKKDADKKKETPK